MCVGVLVCMCVFWFVGVCEDVRCVCARTFVCVCVCVCRGDCMCAPVRINGWN